MVRPKPNYAHFIAKRGWKLTHFRRRAAAIVAPGLASLIAMTMPPANAHASAKKVVAAPALQNNEVSCQHLWRLGTTLTRQTVLALHQANITGNYSVLWDLAHPKVRARMTVADFALAFRALRARHLDLSRIIEVRVNFFQRPRLVEGKLVWAEGWFQSNDKWLTFKAIYLRDHVGWRFVNITITPLTRAKLNGHIEVAAAQERLALAKGESVQCTGASTKR